MTKIIIAPDKFKGSLTALEFCDIVANVINRHLPNAEIIKLPLADGGDGTVVLIQYYLQGNQIEISVKDPLLRNIKAKYILSKDNKTAYIEMAEASGLRLLNKKEYNPLLTSTFGTGELISDAIKKGAKHIILGVGGSATNDAGMGMAKALGFRFYDTQGNELKGIGNDLQKLAHINTENVNKNIRNIKFELACDVENPLFGKNGAAYIYAPQKGATSEMVKELDRGLQNFNKFVEKQFDADLQKLKGSGAAGGLAGGCSVFLNAQLKSGIDLIKQIANFSNKINNADWIITGEGKFDQQTLSGKVIKGIIDEVKHQKVALFCGKIDLPISDLENIPIDYIAETCSMAENIQDSIDNADKYLYELTKIFLNNILINN